MSGACVDEIVANYPIPSLSNPLFWLLDERNSLMALTDIAGATPYTNGYDEYAINQGLPLGGDEKRRSRHAAHLYRRAKPSAATPAPTRER